MKTAREQATEVADRMFAGRNNDRKKDDQLKEFYLVSHGGGITKQFSVRYVDKDGVVVASEYVGIFTEPR